MSFSTLSGTSFQSVFKTEIILAACVKWGEMLRSRLSGDGVKGPGEWRVDRRAFLSERALDRAGTQASVSEERAACAGA